jgi:alkanesulfonate monooxygenase SsuD/methylene tetrahydromethanopterin reductase-like flavin-dependent oxidoreductase (luciferase family)
MSSDIIDIAVVDVSSYHSPKDVVIEMAKRYTAAGVRLWLADQTLNWYPDGLWTPDLAPIAKEWPRNAFWDVYPLAAYIAAKVPGARFLFSLDAIRRGPDVLAQTMMTLQELTGDVIFAIGGGEIKQLAPFGYHTDKPITRMRESIQAIKRLWASDEPFDIAGKTMQLKSAHLGTASYDNRCPRLTVVGAGPKLMEVGAKYADGVMLWLSHESIPAEIRRLRDVAAARGNNPDQLMFWGGNPIGMVMTYDTQEELERMKAAPVTKFTAAAWGRMSSAAWLAEGLESPLGPDFHYGQKMIPTEWPTARVKGVIDSVPEEMIEKGILFWNVDQLAEHFASAVRAGIDMPTWMDWGPFADPTQRWRAVDRAIEAARKAKKLLRHR